MALDNNEILEIYRTGLRNAHALEMTAIDLTRRQAERLETYPDMKARLDEHSRESEVQAQRLSAILERHNTSASTVKNAATTILGNAAAALHAPAPDEILKNTVANYAFEHQEIAAYTSLITMAERVGDTAAIAPLRQSLAEEQAMAEFIAQRIAPTTLRYMELSAAGQKAGV